MKTHLNVIDKILQKSIVENDGFEVFVPFLHTYDGDYDYKLDTDLLIPIKKNDSAGLQSLVWAPFCHYIEDAIKSRISPECYRGYLCLVVLKSLADTTNNRFGSFFLDTPSSAEWAKAFPIYIRNAIPPSALFLTPDAIKYERILFIVRDSSASEKTFSLEPEHYDVDVYFSFSVNSQTINFSDFICQTVSPSWFFDRDRSSAVSPFDQLNKNDMEYFFRYLEFTYKTLVSFSGSQSTPRNGFYLLFALSNIQSPRTGMLIPFLPDHRGSGGYGFLKEIGVNVRLCGSCIEPYIRELEGMRRLQKANTQSAIGSIMSRNGSHNIGSHVLSALSHNIGTMPDDRVLYQYLQQRMDYTATVTTDFPNWIAPTRFVGNLMKTFFSQRHLLEHISESEGLGAYHFQGRHVAGEQKAKIKIHLRKFELSETSPSKIWEKAYSTSSCSSNDQTNGYSGKQSLPMWKEFTDYGENTGKPESLLKDDITVAIPGGVVGQHAFYTIIENIIRNAAKHEWASNHGDSGIDNLEIYIDFIDRKDSAKVEFTIWSACGELNIKDGDNQQESPDNLTEDGVKHWLKELKELAKKKDKEKDGGPEDQGESKFKTLPLHHQLQVKLAQKLIDENGNLRRENWGLAEMKISAGYLQRRSTEVIGGLQDLKSKDYIILPVAVPDPENKNSSDHPKYHLGYRFCIPKPKKILIVTDSSSNSTVSSALKEAGIYFKTIDEIETNEKNENGEVELAYEYVVLPSFPKYEDKTGKTTDFGEWLLPFRVLIDNPSNQENPCAPLTARLTEMIDNQSNQENPCAAANRNKNVLFKHKPFFGGINYNKLIGKNDAVEIQTAVYTAWLEGLKVKCLKSDDCVKQLYLQVQAEGSSGSGQGLVSDRDLYSVVFCECGHSIMMEATRHQKDKTARRLTTLLALMPMDAKDPKYFPNGNGIDSSDYIRDRLRDFCDRFKRELSLNDAFIQMARKLYYDAAAEVVGEKLSQFEQLFLRNVQLDLLNGNAFTKSRVSDLLRHLVETSPRKLSAALDAFCGGETSDFYDSERDPDDIYDSDEEQSQLQKNISRLFGSAELPDEFSELIDKLNSAYLTSDVFLRKYEENISTLPSFYKEQPRAGDTAADGNPSFPIVKPLPLSPVDGTVIRYLRHDNTQKGHYVEALSGSQSYLNALISFDWSKLELITRATENGLLRVLIIDERVYNFLKVRPYELEACRKMNIYAADIENASPFLIPDHGFVTVVNPQKNQNTNQGFGIPAGDFDILIIHQGIIDKWVNAHDRDTVGKLLDEFERRIPYVVVTTGRGRPDNIPDDARVLPFSTIESTLFRKYPEKLVLVNTVMNILPAKPKKPNP